MVSFKVIIRDVNEFVVFDLLVKPHEHLEEDYALVGENLKLKPLEYETFVNRLYPEIENARQN